MNLWGFNANNTNCFHLSGEFEEEILIGGQLVDNFLVGGWHKVERKWGWVICGLVMYKVLIGCGENVGFLPTNCPHFLGPAKVKQLPGFVILLFICLPSSIFGRQTLFAYIKEDIF